MLSEKANEKAQNKRYPTVLEEAIPPDVFSQVGTSRGRIWTKLGGLCSSGVPTPAHGGSRR